MLLLKSHQKSASSLTKLVKNWITLNSQTENSGGLCLTKTDAPLKTAHQKEPSSIQLLVHCLLGNFCTSTTCIYLRSIEWNWFWEPWGTSLAEAHPSCGRMIFSGFDSYESSWFAFSSFSLPCQHLSSLDGRSHFIQAVMLWDQSAYAMRTFSIFL